MAFRDFYSGPPSGFIGSPEASNRLEPDIDHGEYVEYLQAVRIAARERLVSADIPADERPGDSDPLPSQS